MNIETQYALKLLFSRPSFMQVYYEAVANALDAEANEITISIKTDGNIQDPSKLEISISDNGIGFTDERFAKFKEVKQPNDPYHKGLGRYVYLNYFTRVNVKSVFAEVERTFTFTDTFTGDFSELPSVDQPSGTTLVFNCFAGERLKTYDDLRPRTIKGKLLAHFMPYLLNKKHENRAVVIKIELKTDNINEKYDFCCDIETITENDIPEFRRRSFIDPAIDPYSQIEILYLITSKREVQDNLIAVCIDGRTVPIKLIQDSAIPIDYSVIVLFQSELFAGITDSLRQKILLPESVPEESLYSRLRTEVSLILTENMPEIHERNQRAGEMFEEKYPHLAGYIDENIVGLINPDEAIENAQKKFFRSQRVILECDTLDEETYEKSLEIASRTLTAYILYRELIIRRLKEVTEKETESEIHNLLVPRYKRYIGGEQIDGVYSNNAWLLDDKYMTFRTILSESRMDDIIREITLEEEQEGDGTRPDITMIFSANPDGSDGVDVVVVEIKKRVADDKESPYAATQLVKRARKLVLNCPNIQRIWYYAVIEIDDELSKLLQDMKWTPLFSKGKVFFQEFQVTSDDGHPVPVPVCLLSYDAIINDAAARNHTFLEILKNDIKRASKRD